MSKLEFQSIIYEHALSEAKKLYKLRVINDPDHNYKSLADILKKNKNATNLRKYLIHEYNNNKDKHLLSTMKIEFIDIFLAIYLKTTEPIDLNIMRQLYQPQTQYQNYSCGTTTCRCGNVKCISCYTSSIDSTSKFEIEFKVPGILFTQWDANYYVTSCPYKYANRPHVYLSQTETLKITIMLPNDFKLDVIDNNKLKFYRDVEWYKDSGDIKYKYVADTIYSIYYKKLERLSNKYLNDKTIEETIEYSDSETEFIEENEGNKIVKSSSTDNISILLDNYTSELIIVKNKLVKMYLRLYDYHVNCQKGHQNESEKNTILEITNHIPGSNTIINIWKELIHYIADGEKNNYSSETIKKLKDFAFTNYTDLNKDNSVIKHIFHIHGKPNNYNIDSLIADINSGISNLTSEIIRVENFIEKWNIIKELR